MTDDDYRPCLLPGNVYFLSCQPDHIDNPRVDAVVALVGV